MAAPFRVVFSGPAAGTVSAAHFGDRIGDANLLCADVGGTSCDISIVTDGQPTVNTTFELEHDLVVNALSTEISSLGAGGGVDRLDQPRRARSRSARAARAPIPARPPTARAGPSRR